MQDRLFFVCDTNDDNRLHIGTADQIEQLRKSDINFAPRQVSFELIKFDPDTGIADFAYQNFSGRYVHVSGVFAGLLPCAIDTATTEIKPNTLALEVLQQMKEKQKDRRETDGSNTQDLIREARSGGICSNDD